ncbi:hypothetical protein JXC34_00570 [Candidatus Woesearchaeota archaeon]|nr:hypothetical protein [Candidatus Woesearchaeota archaeon]
MNSKNISISEHISKIEVLNDIYLDLAGRKYTSAQERDIAKLKMKLLKKEMLLLCYLIDKDIDIINSG